MAGQSYPDEPEITKNGDDMHCFQTRDVHSEHTQPETLLKPPGMTDKQARRSYRDIGEEYASMRQAYCARSRFSKACAAFHVRLTL
jgi:hypothetical protein